MSYLNNPEVVVGLDVGSTKVSAVVGEVDADGITILGVGSVPCRGTRKGVVSNIDWTVRAISSAIEAAQAMAGVQIGTVYASIGGSHIRSQASDGVVAVAGREVTQSDLDRVLEGARAIPIDNDRMILHSLPREYLVDNQDGVRDPIGMSGVRLQSRVNLISATSSCVDNLMRCIQRAELEVSGVVLGSLASAEAVLTEDEKEIGVGVLDIGGGTTDLVVYADGGLIHTSVIPAGGQNITSDVAAGLRTPVAEADRLKRTHGCALGLMVADDEEIEVPGVGGHAPRTVSRQVLCDIIEPRVEEIFAEARRRLEETGLYEQLAAGIVLTGGSVVMDGVRECAEEVLGLPVRIGLPIGVKGLAQLVQGPQFSTGVGLVRYGAMRISEISASAEAEFRQAHSQSDFVPAKAGTDAQRGSFMDWIRSAF